MDDISRQNGNNRGDVAQKLSRSSSCLPFQSYFSKPKKVKERFHESESSEKFSTGNVPIKYGNFNIIEDPYRNSGSINSNGKNQSKVS